ncbi:MAG: hypothetical protein HKN19_01895, partial [Halioglobus sp.]|nr:hypothetical protein [Halioglobus sp.]
ICDETLVCDDVEGELVCEEIGEEEVPLCEEIEGELVCDGMVCEPFEGELLCDGNLFCNDIEGEFICEEIVIEEPLCEEVEGELICDGMVCEPFEGELLCDGNLFCNDIEGEFVCEEIEIEEPNEDCFEFEGELICDEHCEVIEEELVCDDDDSSDDDDTSDDDSSEDDMSEDDMSDDESEDDASEDDSSEDEEESGDDNARVVLLADIIWLGDDFSRTENVACGPVTEDDVLGARYQNAELAGEEIVLCDDENSRPTTLLPGARIYDRDGNPLQPGSIQEGVVNVVDGFVTDAGLMAVLVIIEPSDEEEREQLSGTIGVLEGESLSLLTDAGDRCVVFDDSATDVFVTGLDEDNNIVFTESSVAGLEEGQRADAFGEQNSEGCLEADTLIIETE